MNLSPEMKNNIYTSLKELDLTDQESQLYLVSLTLGPTEISNLAKHLNVARPNVYLLIKALERVGLVKKYENKFARQFFVEPPTVLLELIRQKKKQLGDNEVNLVSILPDLLATYSQGSRTTKIKVMEGREQFDKTLDLIIEEAKDQIEFFGSFGDYLKYAGPTPSQKFRKQRIAKKIKVRALFFPFKESDKFKANDIKEIRETRILKDLQPFITSFQLFANKIIIWQPKAYLSLLIEDEFMVQMFRSMFDKLWEISK